MTNSGTPMELLFLLVLAIIVAGFVTVFGTILFVFAKGLAQWQHNNTLHVQAVPARVVGKRTDTSGMSDGPVSTWYHATFELPSGERREFTVGGREYGLLAEGDNGTLTFQGTRYHGFERTA